MSGSSTSTSSVSGERVRSEKRTVKPLSKKKLEKHLAAAENRGVLFFSRVPPFLKPMTLRTLLSGMGTEVLRIYLAPEDGRSRAGRVRAGGNKKKSYTEGWVEFDNKRRAKRIASTLNNTPIGGGHRSFYAHDLWNVKYLHKFKWSHLTEKIAYEARVRQDKMRAELAIAKKESAFYMQKVEQAKAIQAMEERKHSRKALAGAATAPGLAGEEHVQPRTKQGKRCRPLEAGEEAANANHAGATADPLMEVRRRFKQRRVVSREAESRLAAGAGDHLLGTLLGT